MEYFLQIALNTAVLTALYALLALGFNFLYSTNKFFDLSYASYLILGTYSFLTISKAHLPLVVTFVLAVLFSVLFAVFVEKYLYSPLRNKKSSGAVMMIASLGVLTVVQALVALVFTSNVQTLSATSTTLMFSGLAITYIQFMSIILAVLVYSLGYFFLKKSVFGIQLRAVSDNEELAVTSQLPVKRIRLIATVIGVTLGVTASILYGMDASFDPYTGMSLLLKAVTVAIIGGLGSIMYGVIGAVFLAVVETLSVWYIGGEWKDAIAFFILILILLFRPTGILKK